MKIEVGNMLHGLRTKRSRLRDKARKALAQAQAAWADEDDERAWSRLERFERLSDELETVEATIENAERPLRTQPIEIKVKRIEFVAMSASSTSSAVSDAPGLSEFRRYLQETIDNIKGTSMNTPTSAPESRTLAVGNVYRTRCGIYTARVIAEYSNGNDERRFIALRELVAWRRRQPGDRR